VTPIGQVTDNPPVMVIHGRLPVRDVREFIAYAKARPGEINFGSPGVGSVTDLSAELFQSITGVEGAHIPYRGADQLLTDLVAGRVHATFLSGNSLGPLIADGSLRALGMTAPTHPAGLRDLPVLETQGLPGFRYESWYVLHAPASTPAPLVERLSALLRAALADEGMRNRLAS
jgi:tripartite-type tricarboxylate transporter receptor subunit TctC